MKVQLHIRRELEQQAVVEVDIDEAEFAECARITVEQQDVWRIPDDPYKSEAWTSGMAAAAHAEAVSDE